MEGFNGEVLKRNSKVDAAKGILILLVVIGHYKRGMTHDIIFLFHMPLFFILSGFLLKKEKLLDTKYLKDRALALMIPYGIYLSLDWLIIRRNFSINMIVHLLWGGRALDGVYWYTTCLITALFLLGFLIKNFSERSAKLLILTGGGIAVLESHLCEHISVLDYPGMPWSIDVALIAIVYLAIGFYFKMKIRNFMEDSNKLFDTVAVMASLFLIIFCVINYSGDNILYYFDMKPRYYKELVLAIVIPCLFGIVLCRTVYWISRIRILNCVQHCFSYLGQVTIPIMYMHVMLNTWKKQLSYSLFVYVLIGIGFPIIFSLVFCRFKIMRVLFGLPVPKA